MANIPLSGIAALALAMIFAVGGTSDILSSIEERLNAGFDEATYRRYLYYCRQQDEGARLAEKSLTWLELYPDLEILRFGKAEGLLMAGKAKEGVAEFRGLYGKSPIWANEIIFTLGELGSEDVTWFVASERKRTGNPTLHARILVDFYLGRKDNRKALSELGEALRRGENPYYFERELRILSERLGKERLLSSLKEVSASLRFQLALSAKDKNQLEAAIREAEDKDELLMMGDLSERSGHLEEALMAYKKADDSLSVARVLVALDRRDEARQILAKDNSLAGREQLASILAGSKTTYREALDTYLELERRYGPRTMWSLKVAALKLLLGKNLEAKEHLAGLAQDSAVIFLKGILAAVEGELDSLKRYVDISLVRFPANTYENDLLLLYEIALTGGKESDKYAMALAAYHWGDANDAYERARDIAKGPVADEANLLTAESLARLGRWKEAEEAYAKLAQQWPASPLAARAQFERALLLRDRLSSPNEAKKLFEQIILTDPGSLYADLARREI